MLMASDEAVGRMSTREHVRASREQKAGTREHTRQCRTVVGKGAMPQAVFMGKSDATGDIRTQLANTQQRRTGCGGGAEVTGDDRTADFNLQS